MQKALHLYVMSKGYGLFNGLVVFYSISTLMGNLMPNPVYIYDFLASHMLVTLSLNEPELICLHTVKWFQVLLSNTKKSTEY